MTGHFLGPVFRADKTEQMTLVTRVSAIRVTIVNTRQGILKCRFVLPWRTNRSSVPSLLDEFQLIFEALENIALIRCHGVKPPFHTILTNQWYAAVIFDGCDFQCGLAQGICHFEPTDICERSSFDRRRL